MDSKDEKFFEQLSGVSMEADAEENMNASYDIELAKASTLAERTKRAVAQPKMIDEDAMEQKYPEGEVEGQLTVDVYQTADDIVVQSAIAGVKADDIDVSVTPDAITIRGARHHEKEVRDDSYLHQECYWGRFSRSIIFPMEIDPESASVSFKNGILTVRLPKANKKKTKKLKVKAE